MSRFRNNDRWFLKSSNLCQGTKSTPRNHDICDCIRILHLVRKKLMDLVKIKMFFCTIYELLGSLPAREVNDLRKSTKMLHCINNELVDPMRACPSTAHKNHRQSTLEMKESDCIFFFYVKNIFSYRIAKPDC